MAVPRLTEEFNKGVHENLKPYFVETIMGTYKCCGYKL